MNQQQRKYAIERIDQICQSKVKNIKKVYGETTLTTQDKIRQIEDGVAEFKLPDKVNKYTDLMDCYRYLGESSVEELEVMDSTIKGKTEEVKQEASSVKDLIMLGDSSEALEAIKSFESSKGELK